MNGDLLLGKFGNGVGKMFVGDGILSRLQTQSVSNPKDVSDGMSLRWSELKAGHFQQLTIGVAKVDRIHETAINGTRVLNTKLS